MIIVMKDDASPQQIELVVQKVHRDGFKIHKSTGERHTIIGVLGSSQGIDTRLYGLLEGVFRVIKVSSPYKLASRSFKPQDTHIKVGKLQIGARNLTMIAGPCVIENDEQMDETAKRLKEIGCHFLRGGAFKPRSSPYAFQGHGEAGFKMIKQAAEKHGLYVVSEILEAAQISLALDYVDIIQIGARNMQNFAILSKLGKTGKPILLKRGMSATIEEWLMSAEYILAAGNPNVILCERGIRTFEPYTRNTLDVSSIPIIKELSHLPILVDPSRSGGRRELVNALSRSAVAAGADGLMIEVHPQPDLSICDAQQAQSFSQYQELLSQCRKISTAIDRTINF